MNQLVKKIAVIGGVEASDLVSEIAFKVGNEISKQGWHLVCGGGSGVMESACKGFRFGRNELDPVRVMAIGVLPGDDADLANRYVDLVIPTGIGIARNAIITRMADGIIAVGRGSGTLSEIAYGWQMNKPVAAMGESGGWAESLAGKSLDNRRDDVIFKAATAVDAIDYFKKKFELI
ncbi:MAG: TIGR00725 family protein [Deltaproteobacteria bacterium]|nr:TIGR00725 family protein [Deltaproteobacteria bacterium]